MSGIITLVGAIDPHTHLRDLDWSHKATFQSETAAAVAGGYWAVFDMPNTPPSTTSLPRLQAKLEAIRASAHCDWGLYFGASQSDNRSDYANINNVCGLKIFNNATTGDLLIERQEDREAHYAAWPSRYLIAVHAEGETVLDVLHCVRKFRKRTHFLHISTAQELRFLRSAKAEGLPITIGVCPHHLFLTEDDLPTLGTFGRMKPELKTRADRDALWRGLEEGLIDVVESDHAPHTRAEKLSDAPPYGVPGLETTLPLLFTAMREGRLSLERIHELVCLNPAQIWGLQVPSDTYTRIDTDASYILADATLHTACGWTPFDGMRVYGRIQETWIRGRKVFDGEQVCVPAGYGQNLFET